MKSAAGLVYITTLSLSFFIVMSCGSDRKSGEPLSIGDKFPPLELTDLLSPEGIGYLKIGSDTAPLFSGISGDLIVLEVLNTYCGTCRTEAEQMNELYEKIQSEPDLADAVKMLAVAIGNNSQEIRFYRRLFHTPYPMIPDPDYTVAEQLGISSTPFHLVIRKFGNEMVVVLSRKGAIESADNYLEVLEKLAGMTISDIEKPGRKRSESVEELPEIVLSDTETLALLRSHVENEKGWTITELERLRLINGSVHRVTLAGNDAPLRLFSREEYRESVCDTCEDTHYLYLFDEQGTVLSLIPIQLPKSDNLPFNAEDLDWIESRIVGRFLDDSFPFNPMVDAVSGATLTSRLIFEGFGEGGDIYRELKKRHYL